MILACGLPYKMLDEQTQLEVIRTVRQHLVTPKGLRTLSPRNPLYKGSQVGTPAERDFAGKNGSVWPWLLSFYVQACFDIDGDSFLPQARRYWPISRRTSRPTASARSASCSTPIPRSHPAEPFRRRGAWRPCWTSTA